MSLATISSETKTAQEEMSGNVYFLRAIIGDFDTQLVFDQSTTLDSLTQLVMTTGGQTRIETNIK